MNLPFEIPDVDWSNSDVRKVVKIIGNKYDQKAENMIKSAKRMKTYEGE